MKTLTNPTSSELVEAFSTLGKEGFILDINDKVARLSRVSKRSKFGSIKVWAYRFKTEQKMLDYCTKAYNDKIKAIEDDIKYKAEQKAKKEDANKNTKVGDIFCYSWGWEQTNVNFYQIIERKGKSSAVIREISYDSVEECSWASENVVPCANDFIGEEQTIRLNGEYFKRSCGYARKTNATDKHYRSWYA